MHYKKIILAACALLSVGMIYGGSATQTVSAASFTERFVESSLIKTTTVTPRVQIIKKVTPKTVSTKISSSDLAMVKLPKGIARMKAETKANPQLEKLIINEFKIPASAQKHTTYYYNYVDLNDDGKKEIFVVINGSYTSGSGGSSALWVSKSGGKLYVNQRFTLMNVPIIISNHKTNGVHDIIVPYSGGGAKSQYKILTGGEASYSDINDTKSIKTLAGIKGKAIITNDILKEIQNGHSGIKLHDTSKVEKETVKNIRVKIVNETNNKTTHVVSHGLPSGIETMKAETKAYPALEALIIDQYDIPDDALNETSYYYNYVDLNDDGHKEIFVVVKGPYTSGSGGSSALWVSEDMGQLYVNQQFTLVNTPVIISDNKTNGMHDLIVPYYGGGAKNQYKVLTGGEAAYSSINDSKSIKTLDGVTGKAIIANDLVKEIQNGQTGLKLQNR